MLLLRSRRLLLPFALVGAVGLGGCADEVTDRANDEIDKQSQNVQDEIKKQSDKVDLGDLEKRQQDVEESIKRGREKLDETSENLRKQADELKDSVPQIDVR